MDNIPSESLKVKIFKSISESALEKSVNEFLRSQNALVHGIKYNHVIDPEEKTYHHIYSCMVIYS